MVKHKENKKKMVPHCVRIARFILIRKEDITGVSGTGVVAEGALFSNGLSIIRWLRKPFSIGIYQTLEDLIQVHGHKGTTQIHFLDQ